MATNQFTKGSLFSNGATPPAAKILTTNFVAGDEVFVGPRAELTVELALSGTAPTTLSLQLEQSMDGTDWAIVDRLGADANLDGATSFHIIRAALTKNAYYRLSAKRTGGDGTTALLAIGHTRIFGGREPAPGVSASLGFISVTDYGAVGDGVADDTAAIAAAIAAIGSDERTLYFPPGTYYFSASESFPSNITPWMVDGVRLVDNGDAGVVLTFNAQIDAGMYQIFGLTGAGSSVAFATDNQSAKIEWWGVSGSATAAQNADRANEAVASTIGTARLLLHGNYTVDDEISATINNNEDVFAIEGAVPGAGFTHDSSVPANTDLLTTSAAGGLVGWCIPQIRNLTLNGYQAAGTASTEACLRLRRCRNGWVESIHGEDADFGQLFEGCISVQVQKLSSEGCGRGTQVGVFVNGATTFSTNACDMSQLYVREKAGGVAVLTGLRLVGDAANNLEIKANTFTNLDYGGDIATTVADGIELVGECLGNTFINPWLEECDTAIKFTADGADVPEYNQFISPRMPVVTTEMDLTVGLDNVFRGGFMATGAVVTLGASTARNQFRWIRNFPGAPGGSGTLTDNGTRNILVSHGSGADDSGENYHSDSIQIASTRSFNWTSGPTITQGTGDPAAGGGTPANNGSLFIRTDGGQGATLYAKYGGADTSWAPQNTRWISKTVGSVITSGTGEQDLHSVTLAQDSNDDFQTLHIRAAGVKAGGVGTKEIKFYFGTQSITIHPALNDATDWVFEAHIDFRSDTNHRCLWYCHHSSTVTSGYDVFTDDLSAGNITLKITGNCAGAGDTINQTMYMVELVP